MRSAKGRIAAHWALALLCAALGYFGGGLFYARFIAGTRADGILALYAVNAAQQLLTFAAPALLILSARPARLTAFRADCRPVTFPTASLCLLLAVGGTVVASAIAALWMHLIGYAGENPPLPDPVGAGQWALALLSTALLPALCEELFFRGLVQSALCRRLPRAGVWIAAAIFAAAHFEIQALPALLLIGVALGQVYRRHGYGASALLHALYNGVVLVLSVRGVAIGLGALVMCVIACVFALRVLLKEETANETDDSGL